MLDLQRALSPLTDILLRREDTEMHREDLVKTEERFEDCVYKPWDTVGHTIPEARRAAWDSFSLQASRGSQLCPYLDFRLLAFRAIRGKAPIAISRQFVKICYDSLWKLVCEHQSIHLSSLSSIPTYVVKPSLLKSLQPDTNDPLLYLHWNEPSAPPFIWCLAYLVAFIRVYALVPHRTINFLKDENWAPYIFMPWC